MSAKVKYLFKVLLVCVLVNSMMVLTAFADDLDWSRFPLVTPESVLLPPEQTRSVIHYRPPQRGSIIAGATLSISNEGGGTIGIYAQTTAYYPLDKCKMRIYLDRWYEDKKSWEMVDYWDITVSKDDNPDSEITMPTVAFDVKGQPTGYYYRLRGLHVVWLGGTSEGFSTQTDGILITK